MRSSILILVYVAMMLAIIVGIDFAFLMGRFWERLIVNIASS